MYGASEDLKQEVQMSQILQILFYMITSWCGQRRKFNSVLKSPSWFLDLTLPFTHIINCQLFKSSLKTRNLINVKRQIDLMVNRLSGRVRVKNCLKLTLTSVTKSYKWYTFHRKQPELSPPLSRILGCYK